MLRSSIKPGSVALHFAAYSLLLLAMKAVPNTSFVLVVTNPSGEPAQAMNVIAGAGGQFVEATRWTWLTVATSTEKNFPTRLRQAGAIAVINFPGAAGCLQEGGL